LREGIGLLPSGTNLKGVAKRIAELRGVSPEEVLESRRVREKVFGGGLPPLWHHQTFP
jgi:hypothetical protein